MTGSSGRTRTCNLVVTRAPKFLLGLDYLITRSSLPKEGVGRFPRDTRSTSSRSSLCTFPDRVLSIRAWLRVTLSRNVRKAGFLEFTRFFNHDFSWKLQLLQPPALPIELPRSRFINLPESGLNSNDEYIRVSISACNFMKRKKPGSVYLTP